MTIRYSVNDAEEKPRRPILKLPQASAIVAPSPPLAGLFALGAGALAGHVADENQSQPPQALPVEGQ